MWPFSRRRNQLHHDVQASLPQYLDLEKLDLVPKEGGWRAEARRIFFALIEVQLSDRDETVSNLVKVREIALRSKGIVWGSISTFVLITFHGTGNELYSLPENADGKSAIEEMQNMLGESARIVYGIVNAEMVSAATGKVIFNSWLSASIGTAFIALQKTRFGASMRIEEDVSAGAFTASQSGMP